MADSTDETLELSASPSQMVWNLKASNGRPFGEANASAEAKEGVDFDLRPCRYPGSRHGLMMNVSALPEVTESWPELHANILFLRRQFLDRMGADTLNRFLMWRFAKLLVAIPAFLIGDGMPCREIPDVISATFKAGQGLYMTLEEIAASADMSSGEMFMPITVQEFVEETEKRGVFVREAEGRACSGPPHMIESLVRAVIDGESDAKPAEPWSVVVDSIEQLLDYESVLYRQELVLQWVQAMEMAASAKVAAQIGAMESPPAPAGSWLEGFDDMKLEGVLPLLEMVLGPDAPQVKPVSDEARAQCATLLETSDGAGLDPSLEVWLSWSAAKLAALEVASRLTSELATIFQREPEPLGFDAFRRQCRGDLDGLVRTWWGVELLAGETLTLNRVG